MSNIIYIIGLVVVVVAVLASLAFADVSVDSCGARLREQASA